MSRPPTPRVKLPDVIQRKPAQPGPNSWALSAEKAGKMKIERSGPPTNRDRYENKPMPPLPITPEKVRAPTTPGKPGYIQPATPLIYSKATPGNRAVTDPVVSKNLFGANKVSIGELRRKFSGAKIGPNLSTVDESTNARVRTPGPQAVELPTGPSMPDGTHKEYLNPPSSAPPSTNAPDPFRSSGTPGRQHQSSPAPTRRYVKEQTSLEELPYEDDETSIPEIRSPDGIIMGDGKLNPTRNGTYGTIGEVEYVEGKAAHRVASYTGVIENASSPTESGSQKQPHSANINPSPSALRGQNLTHLLHPNVYSPSEYGGVWENDPHVGHTLPPFSPMPPRRPFEPELQHKVSSSGSRGTVPMFLSGDPYGQPSRLSAYPPSVASTNSWAPQAQDLPNPPNSATVPPLFSDIHNAVPPPPLTYRDYQQPSGPVPAELARLEMTLHHHLDSCFGSLSRLVTDKHDHTVDHLLRRLESHERKVEKAHKSLKGDVKDMKQEVELLRADVRQMQESNEHFSESLKGQDAKADTLNSKLEKLQSKLADLEKTVADVGAHVHGIGDKCDAIVEQTGRRSIISEYPQQHNNLSPTRSHSTQASPGLQSQRQPYERGASQTPGTGQQSGTISRGRRANTASGRVAAGSSDGRSSRREYYADMGATLGEAPDLRQHPAFVSQQQHYGYDANGAALGMASDGTLYQIPSFAGHGPNGWYQQAYGQS